MKITTAIAIAIAILHAPLVAQVIESVKAQELLLKLSGGAP
jgi:hypothetical protein